MANKEHLEQMLKQAAALLRSLEQTNQELREKLAAQERTGKVRDLADKLEEKGLHPELTLDEKVAALTGMSTEDLALYEKMASASMAQFPLGSVGNQNSDSSLEDADRALKEFLSTY